MSILRHVVRPNKASVYIHMWNPELRALLDGLFSPVYSEYEPVRSDIDILRSRHLSLKLVLKEVKEPLIFAARLDLLFWIDLTVPALHWDGVTQQLWLPHSCQRNNEVTPQELHHIGQRECGCASSSSSSSKSVSPGCSFNQHRGSLIEAPSVKRAGVMLEERMLPHNRGMYLQDMWFVATRQVAWSFTSLYDNFTKYRKEVRSRCPACYRWAHFYWAHHVTHHLPDEVQVSFHLLQGMDFMLARLVRFGRDCEVKLKRSSYSKLSRAFNQTAMKLKQRAYPLLLSEQCPSRFRANTAVSCPWYTPACEEGAVQTIEEIRRATKAVEAEGLPPFSEVLFDRSVPTYRRLLRRAAEISG